MTTWERIKQHGQWWLAEVKIGWREAEAEAMEDINAVTVTLGILLLIAGGGTYFGTLLCPNGLFHLLPYRFFTRFKLGGFMKFPGLKKIILSLIGFAAVSTIINGVAEQHFLFEALLWVLAGVAFWQYRKWSKNKKRDRFGETIRGSQIEDTTASRRLFSGKGRKGDQIEIGGVPIPREYEPSGTILVGTTGQGKTVVINNILDVVRARGQRAVIYDSTGEFVKYYYREGQDVILTPIDQRSAVWTPWMEGTSPYAYANLASSFIPDGTGESLFWTAAAKAVLRACLAQARTLDDLINLVFRVDADTLMGVMEAQGLLGLIGPEKMFSSSRGTSATYLESLAYLPRPNPGQPIFSIRDWVRHESADSWLFIPSREDVREAIQPLVSMWIGTAIQSAMSLSPDRDRRLWMILDELPTLNKLRPLDTLLAGGRKYGLATILGIQSIGQMWERYGRDSSSALLSHPVTRLVLRAGDADTADYLSRSIGERHSLRDVKSQSDSSASTAEQHTIERAVLPSEIMSLPKLHGYLRTPDRDAIQKIRLQYKDRDQSAPAYVNRPLDAPPRIPATETDDLQMPIPQALIDK